MQSSNAVKPILKKEEDPLKLRHSKEDCTYKAYNGDYSDF